MFALYRRFAPGAAAARPDKPTHLAQPAELIDLILESLAPVHPGGVIFHHGQTLHTSGPNRSDGWCRAYASHWVTAQTQDIRGPDGLLTEAYFNLPKLAEICC